MPGFGGCQLPLGLLNGGKRHVQSHQLPLGLLNGGKRHVQSHQWDGGYFQSTAQS